MQIFNGNPRTIQRKKKTGLLQVMKQINDYFFGTEEFEFEMLWLYVPVIISLSIPVILACLG